ncbi:MAG: tetratricopeptide repeat protein [Cyanobacteria bacterium J06632_22]
MPHYPHGLSPSHQPTVRPQPRPQPVAPQPIQQDDYEDGWQGLSGFQLHETVTRHLQNRRYSAALLTLAAGEMPDRQTPWFWHLQGEALANLGRYRDALASFDQALGLAPDRTESLVFQAVCYVHLQHYAQALSRCDRALDLAPRHTQAWLFRGVALQRLGRHSEAYRSYEQALPQSPARPRPFPQIIKRTQTAARHLVQACRHWLSPTA